MTKLDQYLQRLGIEVPGATAKAVDVEAGKAGYTQYLADVEAATTARNNAIEAEKSKQTWWDKAASIILQANGMSSTMTNDPISTGFNQAVAAYKSIPDDYNSKPTDDWTDDERWAFGEKYAASADEAYAFAKDLNSRKAKEQKQKQQEAIAKWSGKNLGTGLLGSAASLGLNTIYGGVGYLDALAQKAAGKEIEQNILLPHEAAGAMQSGVATKLNEKGGTLNENIPIIGGKGWGDVYGLGMSIGQSTLGAATGGSAGTLIQFFGMAASQGVTDALSRGANGEQAIAYGTIAGAAEAITEMISVDKLLGITSSEGLQNVFKNILKQAGEEAREEFTTAMITNVADNWIMGGKSQFYQTVNQLVASGMSEEEAKKKAWLQTIEDIAFDTISGALSGATTGAGATIVNRANQMNDTAANDLAKQILAPEQSKLIEDAKQYDTTKKRASALEKKVADGKELSGYELRMLSSQLNEAKRTKDVDTVRKAIVEQMKTEGVSEAQAKTLGEIALNKAIGNDVSKVQELMLKRNAAAMKVYNQISAEVMESGIGESEWAEKTPIQRLRAEKKASEMISDVKTQPVSGAKLEQVKGKYTEVDGKITFKKNENSRIHIDGITSSLTADDIAELSAIEKIANALGVDVHVYETTVNEKGERMYTDKTGKKLSDSGYYDPNDNSIHIDLRAGQNGEGTMLYTASHEVVHFIKENAPEHYDALEALVTKELVKGGFSMEKAIEVQRNKAIENGQTLTDEQLREEVIAEACQSFLASKTAVAEIKALKTKNKGLWTALQKFFTSFFNKINKLYKETPPDAPEGKYIADMHKAVKNIRDAFLEGAVEAGKKANAKTTEKTTAKEVKSQARVTSEQDAAYLDAVKRGDMETAQKMVDEAAEKAFSESKIRLPDGKLRTVYHGTNTGDFTVFNPDFIGMSSGDDGFFGMGFYFAYSKGEAKYYGAKRIISAYLDLKNPFDFETELQKYKGEKASGGNAPDAVALMNFADKFEDVAKDITIGVVEQDSDTVKEISLAEFSKAFKDVIENKKFEYSEITNEYGEKETLVTADPKTYEYEYNGEKHTYKDYSFQKRFWGKPNSLDVAYEYLASSVYRYIDMIRRTRLILDHNRAFTAALKEKGYDGAIQSQLGDEAVAFSPEQIKSADPVTYDDHGDVIPLSERFNESNKDIRYKARSVDKYTEKEYNSSEIFTETNEFMQAVPYGSREAFRRSLANQTGNLADGEVKLITINAAGKVYFFAADGYMKGTIVSTSTKNIHELSKEIESGDQRIDKNTEYADLWTQAVRNQQGKSSVYNTVFGIGRRSDSNDRLSYSQSRSDRARDTESGTKHTYAPEEIDRIIQQLKELYGLNEDERIRHKARTTDNLGNELTDAQAEYFKNSKVRDGDGNLLVVYHGTRKADFTEFKRNINFFTDSEEMADSYSPNGEKHIGYLNITKPFVIDAKGARWSRIPIDAETKTMLDAYGSSSFKEGGKWRSTPADIASAIEEGVDEGEFDYDGIIINNLDDTGSYAKSSEKIIANDYIAFSSSQFKNITNTAPTKSKDIRHKSRSTASAPYISPTAGSIVTDIDSEYKYTKADKALSAVIASQIAFTNAQAGIEHIGKKYGVKNIESLVQAARVSKNQAEEMIAGNQYRIGADTKEYLGEGLQKIIQPLNDMSEEEQRAFFDYLLHYHNADRMSLERRSQEWHDEKQAEYDKYAARLVELVKEKNTLEKEIRKYATKTEFAEKLAQLTIRLTEIKRELAKVADLKRAANKALKATPVLKNKPVLGLNREEIAKQKNDLLEQIKTLREEKQALAKTKHTPDVIAKLRDLASQIDSLETEMKNLTDAVSEEQSREIISEYESNYPDFKEIAEKIWKYNSNLNLYRVDAGLINQEQFDYLQKLYPHYVPAYRADNKTGIAAVKGKNNVAISKTIKVATGSTKDILNPIVIMARQTMETVRAGRINQIANALYDGAKGDTTYLAAISKEKVKGQDVADLDPTTLRPKNNQVTFFKNGEKIVLQVSSEIFAGFDAFTPDAELTNPIKKLTAGAMNVFKKLVTSANPAFLIRNGARDLQDAGINTKYGTAFAKSYAHAISEIKNDGEKWKLYRAMGGSNESYFDFDKGFKKQQTAKGFAVGIKSETAGTPQKVYETARNAIQRIENANNYIETLPRFAEFIASLEAGNTAEQAMLDAADVTTNFARTGKVTKALNKYVIPFLNPSIQGASKAYRNVKDAVTAGDAKTVAKEFSKLAFKAALIGVLPMLLNGLMYRDDEEYKDLRETDKENNFLIKVGDTFWKIPRGRMASVIAGLFNRSVYAEEFDLKGYLENVSTQMSPVESMSRTIFSPFMDVKNNVTWYGSAIEGKQFENLSPSQRYDESTSSIAIAMAKFLNKFGAEASPKKIHYLLDQYSGVIGDFILPATSKKAEKDFLSGNFTIDPVTSNKLSDQFYDMYYEAQYAKNADENDKVAEYQVKHLNRVKSAVSKLFEEKSKIQNSDLSDKEKLAETRAIQILINEAYKTALEDYDLITNAIKATSKVDDKYRYTEVLHLVYGAQTALEQYDEKVYEKSTLLKKSGVSYEVFYNYYFATRDIESDKDKKGNPISGSKKTKVIKAIDKINTSEENKLLLIAISGYSFDEAKDKEKLIKYINNLKISAKDKATLAELCGFEYKNGKIYASK